MVLYKSIALLHLVLVSRSYGFLAPPSSSLTAKSRATAFIPHTQVSESKSDSIDVDIGANEIKPVYDPISNTKLEHYQQMHDLSITDPKTYWGNLGSDLLDWFHPFNPNHVRMGGFENGHGDMTWFAGGKLNMCYNAIDRHVNEEDDSVALIWEGDEPDDVKSYTYKELLTEISKIANALKASGVQKGDVVTIYMPMIPQLMMTMLACARIGAVHSIVFAGFSSEALGQRIEASGSQFLVTADRGVRGAKTIPLKDIANDAIKIAGDQVEKVFVFERYHGDESKHQEWEQNEKDVLMDELVAKQKPYCPCEIMDAEDDLFILYTSGSTGNPKGLVHTTAGYALYAMHTSKQVFDLKKGDLFACVADCGWITGHTYVVYGPLLNGGTTFMFESTPMYPDAGRYWDMVERHKINVFYTAPTAIRSLMRYGDAIPKKYDTSSLRVLGSVGEPINPEAWRWYYEVVGESKCSVVDTYWQTETGGHIIANLPGTTPMKPGSCTLPFYGIDPVILDAQTGEELEGNDVEGVLAIRQPWPGMARTCLGDHARYETVYLQPYPGYYFTGDSAMRDKDGYYFITGRVDDVLNVSGHRIGTAEVESALVGHYAVAQAAVVGFPHPIKGQAIACFTTLTTEYDSSVHDDKENGLQIELKQEIRKNIGPFASPDLIIVTDSLPMTRSGKIMRRILRKIVSKETDSLGDTSTLADPSVVNRLIDLVGEK